MQTVGARGVIRGALLVAMAALPACVSTPRMSQGDFARRLATIERSDVAAVEVLASRALASGLPWEAAFLYEDLGRRTGDARFALAAVDVARRLSPSPAQGSGELLIVANGDVAESVATARFYARLRDIPPRRIVFLSCPDREEIERTTFDEMIAAPIREALDSSGGVRYLAVCFGVPLKVRTGKDSDNDKRNSGRAAVDAELALLRMDAFDPDGMYANPQCPWQSNAYRARKVPAGTPILIVSRLDGPTALDAKMLALRAVLAERFGVAGAAYVDHAPGTTSYAGFLNAFLRRSAKLLRDSERFDEVVVEASPALFEGPCENVIAYEGWYSPEPMQGVFQWNLGAVGYHIYSFSARTLRARTLRNESWCSMMVREGVTATVGHVYEPHARNVFRGYTLWDGLLGGGSFGESALRATPYLSWMNVAIGDPLYRPFGKRRREGKKEFSLARPRRHN